DYSIRARGARTDEALGLALWEVNALADVLRGQRLGALEATALLRRVIAEVDVAVFTFDQDQRLRLLNRAGERFLGQGAARALGRTAGDLGLAACLEGEVPRTVELPFGGRLGRWEVRRSAFRQDGRPHQLVVLSDLSRALREEERQAWQRLIRVLGHEINNSLAPIQSIAKSLGEALDRGKRPGTAGPTEPADSAEDFRRGLAVIAARSESLSRFMAAYSRLARLPRPTLAPVDLPALVRRVAGLETRLSVRIGSQSALSVAADADQLEQLLINLVSNAVDAALETGGGVNIGWDVVDHAVEVRVEDEGPGIPETANLFVPFYTTKPEGSGIGLVLSRQIAEAHGGTLTLENRAAGRGCVARLTLPV
ncbi:MAG: PAS domain-containing sensor histidine kinase, partial [Gemmatimonadetes bacterium]|nr:PAS domain-containing sensor histidine kinase [Gemmatimonadota bacterium]